MTRTGARRTATSRAHRERQAALIAQAQSAMVAQAQAQGRRDAEAAAAAEATIRAAIGELIQMDENLIDHIVHRATPQAARLDPDFVLDLMQEGRHAYWKAVERYDPARGNAFSTLVWTAIWRTVRRYIEDHGYSIRVPGAQQRRMRQVLWHRDRLRTELGRDPNFEEISLSTGLTMPQFRACFAFIAAHGRPPTIAEMAEAETLTEVQAKRRDGLVLRLRREPTVAELAAVCGISVEQVRHLTHIPRVSVELDDETQDDAHAAAETMAVDESEVSNPLVYLPHDRVIELLYVALDGTTARMIADSFGLNAARTPLDHATIAANLGHSIAEVRHMIRAGIETLSQPTYRAIAQAWATDPDSGQDAVTDEPRARWVTCSENEPIPLGAPVQSVTVKAVRRQRPTARQDQLI